LIDASIESIHSLLTANAKFDRDAVAVIVLVLFIGGWQGTDTIYITHTRPDLPPTEDRTID